MKISLLFIGLSHNLRKQIKEVIKDSSELICSSLQQVKDLRDKKDEMALDLIFVGSEMSESNPMEISQIASSIFPSEPIYYVTSQAEGFNRDQLKTGGFKNAFLLPMEHMDMLVDVGGALADRGRRAYTSVRLVYIEPDQKLDFQISVLLKANQKYLNYSAAGTELEMSRLERLRRFNQGSIYVPIEQLGSFYAYSAKRLNHMLYEEGLESEAARGKLISSIRELFGGMLNDSYATALNPNAGSFNHTGQIVSSFIQAQKPPEWFRSTTSTFGKNLAAFSHEENVSHYAVLFSMVSGVGDPVEMAAAGLLHDLGIKKLPGEIQVKNEEDLSPEERLIYQQHPALAIEVLQESGIIVPDSVKSAILHHHERSDGSGYPDKLKEEQIPPEAQVLAIADRFDYLTRISSRNVPLSPDQAVNQMNREGLISKTMLEDLMSLFMGK
jgi:HD-GYP domain-containing protein (c-di-GMP phosphodiesterase class II)